MAHSRKARLNPQELLELQEKDSKQFDIEVQNVNNRFIALSAKLRDPQCNLSMTDKQDLQNLVGINRMASIRWIFETESTIIEILSRYPSFKDHPYMEYMDFPEQKQQDPLQSLDAAKKFLKQSIDDTAYQGDPTGRYALYAKVAYKWRGQLNLRRDVNKHILNLAVINNLEAVAYVLCSRLSINLFSPDEILDFYNFHQNDPKFQKIIDGLETIDKLNGTVEPAAIADHATLTALLNDNKVSEHNIETVKEHLKQQKERSNPLKSPAAAKDYLMTKLLYDDSDPDSDPDELAHYAKVAYQWHDQKDFNSTELFRKDKLCLNNLKECVTNSAKAAEYVLMSRLNSLFSSEEIISYYNKHKSNFSNIQLADRVKEIIIEQARQQELKEQKQGRQQAATSLADTKTVREAVRELIQADPFINPYELLGLKKNLYSSSTDKVEESYQKLVTEEKERERPDMIKIKQLGYARDVLKFPYYREKFLSAMGIYQLKEDLKQQPNSATPGRRL